MNWWLVIVAGWLLMNAAAAQTLVAGNIATDSFWAAANGPYLLSGDVVIQNGATLTLEAGTTVYMGANASLTVQAGAVQAKGNAANPVRVLSDKTRQGQAAAPGDWGQWVFTSGTLNTRLDYVLFEHGRGVVVNGSAPVLNYLTLRNHQGAAITVDLSASPVGVGNLATGNTLNGVAVPAGDITGNVKWGLRGIPYVVGSGKLSVGKSPALQAVEPGTVEQGQTVNLKVTGTRLDGVTRASFSQTGLPLTLLAGNSTSQVNLQLQAAAAAATGTADLRLQVDAGEIVLANAITIIPPIPAISSLSPNTVLAGAGPTEITVIGRNFTSASEVLFSAAAVTTRFVSATELRATLPSQSSLGTLQAQARSPDAAHPGQYLLSNQVALTVQAPVPPTLTIEPTPIALPPDSKPHNITIRLSKADYRDNTLTLSTSDATRATASPTSVLVPAGQTSAQVSITPLQAGTASFMVDSANLQRISVPLFITSDFRGANTAYSVPVGIVVESASAPVASPTALLSQRVGIAVGGVLSNVSPAAWALGYSPTVTVYGTGIPSGAQVSMLPSTGLTLGAPAVSADGTQLQFVFDAAADAPVGPRRVVVKGADGKELAFTDPAKAYIQLMTGLPTVDSVGPNFATRGTLIQLSARGRNLQQGRLSVSPAGGIVVDANPQISADGTSLTAYLQIAADAPLGNRLAQVTTPAATSADTASPANTLSIVSSVGQTITPVAAPLVGVMVGSGTSTPVTASTQSAALPVGVLLGAGVAEISPKVGVTGTQTVVTVRGAGLQSVTAVSLAPATGITLTAPSVNPAGTELSFTATIDANAALGARRLRLLAGSTPVTFSMSTDDNFLISAPIPELDSVSPPVLLAGQPTVAMTVRGRNLANITGVRFDPPQNITVTSPFVSSAGGTSLSFSATVAAGASSGIRTVIVGSVAGESSAVQQAGNMVRIASQLGSTYAHLSAPLVGVHVGETGPTTQNVASLLASDIVGVTIDSTPASQSINSTVASARVGAVVGGIAQTMIPNGWLQGVTGTITVTGSGLSGVTSVSATPATGLLFAAPSSAATARN